MEKNGSVNSNDRFYFAGDISYHKCDEGWLAISIQSANWILLRSDFQKEILDQFIKGHTVGKVYQLVDSEVKLKEFQNILAAIFERKFASTEGVPQIHYLQGTKMLNCYLTNACNLRCSHCFMKSGQKLRNELSLDEWKRILKEFHNEGGEYVTFTGGEPLMNPNFDEIVKFASSQGLTVTVLSNGILWNKDKIQSLSKYIDEVQISIDGVDETTNAVVRGEGHFERVVNTVVDFANNDVRTSVATTFTFQNLQNNIGNRYCDFVERIKSRCHSPVFFKLSKKVLNGRSTYYTEDENKKYFHRIVEIEKQLDPNSSLSNFMEGHTPNLVERNCGFGGISIGPDGEIYFCNRTSEVESYGNVHNSPLKPYMELGHKIHLQTSVECISPCKDCDLRNICCGGCRIDECNFHGKLKDHKGPLIQTKCTEETKRALKRKMIDSFLYHITFD